MDLYLLRHGEAEPERASDELRALTPAGLASIHGVARGLQRRGIHVEAVWHSPFVRTRQTAAIVHAVVGGSLVEEPRIVPGGAVRTVGRDLFASHARALMLVSHMPFLPNLVAGMTGERATFGTGSLAHLVVDEGRAELRAMWTAEELGAQP